MKPRYKKHHDLLPTLFEPVSVSGTAVAVMVRSKRKRTPEESDSNHSKRKRKSSTTNVNTTRLGTDKPSASQKSTGSETEYSARQILDEKGNKYLIEWEDNIVTGESYSPTWVRLTCACRDLERCCYLSISVKDVDLRNLLRGIAIVTTNHQLAHRNQRGTPTNLS